MTQVEISRKLPLKMNVVILRRTFHLIQQKIKNHGVHAGSSGWSGALIPRCQVLHGYSLLPFVLVTDGHFHFIPQILLDSLVGVVVFAFDEAI